MQSKGIYAGKTVQGNHFWFTLQFIISPFWDSEYKKHTIHAQNSWIAYIFNAECSTLNTIRFRFGFVKWMMIKYANVSVNIWLKWEIENCTRKAVIFRFIFLLSAAKQQLIAQFTFTFHINRIHFIKQYPLRTLVFHLSSNQFCAIRSGSLFRIVPRFSKFSTLPREIKNK